MLENAWLKISNRVNYYTNESLENWLEKNVKKLMKFGLRIYEKRKRTPTNQIEWTKL